jgi:hypothetical protein
MPDSLDDWLCTVDQTVTFCETDRDRIGAVFVASACEAMLREVVEFLLQRQHVSPKLISHLVDNARGREALHKLYDVVAPSPMRAVLKEAALLPWFEAWGHLAQVRNKYAHGRQAPESLANKIHVVARHMDEAFIALRNAGLILKGESRFFEST